jgi:Xaa-Pro aminopeptidase
MTDTDTKNAFSDRLAKLRNELEDQKLDGFIVPKADEHQGEYVAPRSERLEWLSGFSGSAGMAIVLSDNAAIFVDGRYTIQVRDEVDAESFEYRHITDEPASAWITENLTKGKRLGYDAWLHTPTQISILQTACDKAGVELIAVSSNPIDTIWEEQPPAPLSPTVPLSDEFTGLSSANKRNSIADILKSRAADALFLSAPDSIAWLLNIRGSDVPFTPFALSFALLHQDGTVDWFIDSRKPIDGMSQFLGTDVRMHEPDQLGDHLDQLANKQQSVHLDFSTDPKWIHQRLVTGGAHIVRGSDPCQLAKAQKNPTELDGVRRAHSRDGVALCRFLSWLSGAIENGGESEISISDQLEDLRKDNNLFQGLSFPTIAGSGPNGAICHYRVSDESNRKLDHNSLLLVDSGAQYLDGTTDVTRTMPLGSPSQEMIDNFTLVLKGHIALATAKFPVGTTGSQLDVLARLPLWQAGLDYDHGTGHGVGCYLSVHEGPQRISKMPNTVALKPGMIISNEPGYYKTDAYGIRIENLVAVVEVPKSPDAERDMLEFETLTLAPIERSTINIDMLTDDEISWIDRYHQRVRDEIGPSLDDEAKTWLDAATQPLT